MHWKFYFIINILLLLFSIWSVIFFGLNNTNLSYNPIDYLFLFFSIITLIGLYTYIFKKKILVTVFWKVIFIIEILLVAYGVINGLLTSPKELLPYNLQSLQVILATVGLSILGVLWDLPKIYALYKLGFPKTLPS